MIESLQNEKVKYWTHLKEKKFREQEGLFLVEEDHLVKEALKRHVIKEIISTKPIDFFPTVFLVSEKVMKKITSQVTFPTMIAVCYKTEEKIIEDGPILLLDHLQDPGNLGTILRSAVAFSFKGVFLSQDCVDVYNPKTIRSTEGMLFHIPIQRGNIKEYLLHLKENGYRVYDTCVEKGEPISKMQKQEKIAIVIGNEGKGVSKEIHELCDSSLSIPIHELCESLNASIAAAIFMYEVRR